MPIDMSSIRKVRADKAPRILIYGPPKIGKTTLASEYPRPIFLQTEDGASGSLEIDSFGHLTSFNGVMDAMSALASDEHEYQTVVLDSLSELEKLVFAETCARNNWQSLEQPGYGKGYNEADAVWKEFVDAMNYLRTERSMMIVLIGHANIEQFDDPETSSYSRYDIALHKRGKAILQREVDAILLLKKDVTIKTEDVGFNKKRTKAEGGDTRWIYCEGKPSYTAGNRYSMPEKVMYQVGHGYEKLAPYFPNISAAAPEQKAA